MHYAKICGQALLFLLFATAALAALNDSAILPWPLLEKLWLLLPAACAALIGWRCGRCGRPRGAGAGLALAFCLLLLLPLRLCDLPPAALFWTWRAWLLILGFALLAEGCARTPRPQKRIFREQSET